VKQEYSFTLTLPLEDIAQLEILLVEIREHYRSVRVSRKTDRKECARYYLSFPFSSARPDLHFASWVEDKLGENWDLFGPTYGRWGLSG